MLERSDDTNEATWTMQLPDSNQVCSVAEWHWMVNSPCAQDDAGECDIQDA